MRDISSLKQTDQVDNLIFILRSIKELKGQSENRGLFSHESLIAQLVATGWYEEFHDTCNAYFRNKRYPLREIIVPINTELFDYNGAIFSAVEKMVDCEYDAE